MAAINFPSSPSNGDTFVVDGVTYTYNSAETKWKTTINSNAFLPLSGGTVSGNLSVSGDVTVDTNTLYVDSTNNRVGVGSSSPKETIDCRGAAVFSGDHATGANAYDTAHGIMLSSTSGLASIKAVSNGANNVDIRFIPLSSGSGSEAVRIDSSGNLKFNSGYGSVATAYGVRAWVNFDGTSGSIGSGRANGNVSSVTDNGSGDYTVNFSTALSDANYCAFGSVIGSSNTDATDAFVSAGFNAATATHTTSAFRFTTAHRTQGAQDYNQVQVAVIR